MLGAFYIFNDSICQMKHKKIEKTVLTDRRGRVGFDPTVRLSLLPCVAAGDLNKMWPIVLLLNRVLFDDFNTIWPQIKE